MSRPFPAEEVAHSVGGLVWCERAFFAAVGSWVHNEGDPAVAEYAALAAAHHAQRADWLAPRLHDVADRRAEELVTPPSAAASAAVAVVADAPDTAARIAVHTRGVLSALLVGYDALSARTTPHADGPTRRLLRLVRGDVTEDLATGLRLLFAVGDPADLVTSGRTVGKFDRAWRGEIGS